MPVLPVVVAPLFPSNPMWLTKQYFRKFVYVVFFLPLVTSAFSYGQDASPLLITDESNRYLAKIRVNSISDVKKALERADKLLSEGKVNSDDKPVAFVLHGPEIQIFFRDNYQRYKAIVDLAAKLSAFNVVDLQVCRTRLGILGENEKSLPPFVETVPYGPAEVKRLIAEERYVYF